MGRLKSVQSRVEVSKESRLQSSVSADTWRQGKTSTQRGYGYKWQKARRRFLDAHPLCVACQANGRPTLATDVDHRIPHRGDQSLFWDESNWQALCHSCHSEKTGRGE